MTKVDRRTKEYKESLKVFPNEIVLANETQKPLYRVTLKVNDTEKTAEGNDLEQTILQLAPPFYKTLAYLTMERDGKKIEMRFGVFQCKMFFQNRSTRKIKCAKFEHLFV